MNHLTILVLKFISSCIAFAVGLDLFFHATFTEVVSFALTLTIISYFIGDRILLPRIGNRNAIIVDFFLAYTSVWLFGPFYFHSYHQIAWGSILSAIIVSIAEVFIHRFILKSTPDGGTSKGRETNRNQKLAYGVEMAEENNPLGEQ